MSEWWLVLHSTEPHYVFHHVETSDEGTARFLVDHFEGLGWGVGVFECTTRQKLIKNSEQKGWPIVWVSEEAKSLADSLSLLQEPPLDGEFLVWLSRLTDEEVEQINYGGSGPVVRNYRQKYDGWLVDHGLPPSE